MAGDFDGAVEQLRAGEHLARPAAAAALAPVLAGTVAEEALGEFLTLLSRRAASVDEMAGFLDAMMAAATVLEVAAPAMDVVGTGGDRLGTVNISTMAALTVAACGVPVAKHGNRAASSPVGTADVLEGLGVRIDVAGPVIARCVQEANFGFLFAQRFHPGLRHLAPIRRRLGVPTVFNLLGPLANPARVTRLVVGVADATAMDAMAAVLRLRGVERAALVHGDDGLDELSLGGPSTLVEVRGDAITATRVDVTGSQGVRHGVASLAGGNLADNVRAVEAYLAGAPGPVADTAVANAGLALVVAGHAADLDVGTAMAREAVLSGRARAVLARVAALTSA